MASPPSPQPKHLNVPVCGNTKKEGVFSPWNGQHPTYRGPHFFSCTVWPTNATKSVASNMRSFISSGIIYYVLRLKSPVYTLSSGITGLHPKVFEVESGLFLPQIADILTFKDIPGAAFLMSWYNTTLNAFSHSVWTESNLIGQVLHVPDFITIVSYGFYYICRGTVGESSQPIRLVFHFRNFSDRFHEFRKQRWLLYTHRRKHELHGRKGCSQPYNCWSDTLYCVCYALYYRWELASLLHHQHGMMSAICLYALPVPK